jgi:hypothetical protein
MVRCHLAKIIDKMFTSATSEQADLCFLDRRGAFLKISFWLPVKGRNHPNIWLGDLQAFILVMSADAETLRHEKLSSLALSSIPLPLDRISNAGRFSYS